MNKLLQKIGKREGGDIHFFLMRVSVKPKITAEMAQALLTCHGWSQYKIAKEFCISSKTVSSIANRIYVKKSTR